MLIERPGHVFTKQEIFERLWPNTAVTDHALTRVVAQLRRVLGDEARDGRYIETVPTRGYRWLPKVEAVARVTGTPVTCTGTLRHPGTRHPAHWAIRLVTVAICFGSARHHRVDATRHAPNEADPSSRPAVATSRGRCSSRPMPASILHPAFSPQGDAVAFASDRSGTFELYVRALAGTATEVALTSDGQHNVQPAWSPDGSLIAFHSHGRGGMWVMPARGGVPRQLAVEGSQPAWSADGARIAFQSDEPSDVTPSAFGAQSGATIKVVDVDGRNLRQLTMARAAARRSRRAGMDHAMAASSPSACSRARATTACGWCRSRPGRRRSCCKAMRGHYELAFAPDDSALYVAGGEPFITRIPFDTRRHRRSVSAR